MGGKMNMKKLLTVAMVFVLAFTMVACNSSDNGGGASPSPSASAPAETGEASPEASAPASPEISESPAASVPAAGGGKEYNIGVSIYSFDDAFMTLYRNEIKAYFDELASKTGNTYKVNIMDAKNDMAEQTNQVDTFIAQGVDAMIINLVQSSSAATITAKVAAADIPTVYINREPSEEDMAPKDGAWDKYCYVGADARQSGTYQGEIIRDLPNKGDANGDGVVAYVMIMGDPENVDAQHRTEFSIKALTDAGIEVKELFKQRGDWKRDKGQELAATALAQSGEEIDVIFCNNDDMAVGAYQSIQSAGRKVGEDIYLVGVDALAEAMDLVNNGQMTGTVLNDHEGQSHTACDMVLEYLDGKSPEKLHYVDYIKKTKE